ESPPRIDAHHRPSFARFGMKPANLLRPSLSDPGGGLSPHHNPTLRARESRQRRHRPPHHPLCMNQHREEPHRSQARQRQHDRPDHPPSPSIALGVPPTTSFVTTPARTESTSRSVIRSPS